MRNLGIWNRIDLLGEKLSENSGFSKIVDLLSDNFTGLFLKKTKDGYSREIKGVEVEMTEQYNFTDILINKPIEGYTKYHELEEIEMLIDAGAFPGALSIIAAEKDVDVVALEPDPNNAEELRRNLKLNSVADSVTVVEKGLWDEKTKKSFRRDKALGMSSRIKEDANVEIQLDTLDNIVNEFGNPDLIKMDIEGAELEALKGATYTLEEAQPDFKVASYHLNDQGEKTFHEIEEIFSEHGYNYETSFSRHLTTYASKKDKLN